MTFCNSEGIRVRSDVLKKGMSDDGNVNSSSRSCNTLRIRVISSRNTANLPSASSGGSTRSTTSNT